MSYEGMREDERVCKWVCFGDEGRCSVTDTSPLMSISDLPVCKEKSAVVLFCMYNAQTEICSCGVWSHYNPYVYKHMPV